MKHHLLKLSPREFCAATDPCSEWAEFAARFQSMSAVWEACPNVGWLIWILDAIGVEHDEKAERLFAVWCARNTPMADGRVTGDLLTDPRSRASLEVAERFANGKATDDELAAAWDAAVAAADSAWDAAGEAQCAEFRRVIKNPFLS